MEANLPLIQISEEDDSLLQHFPDLNYSTSSPLTLSSSHYKNLKNGIHMEKPSCSSSEAINNKENIISNNVEVPKLCMEPMQMKRRKKGAGYNLRKSLAWDRAFFTDEGILDPLELTLITGIDANTCGGGLPSICEEGNSSFSSDASCTNDSSHMEASEAAPLKELRDKNRTPKENRETTDCSVRNHGSLLHPRVTHKALSSDRTNRGRSKVGGRSEPLSSLKRPANSNILKSAKKESKLTKLSISKPGSCVNATPNGSMEASRLRHNLIPKPTKIGDKNSGLKSSLQNVHVHDSQSKAKTGSDKVHLPVRELAEKTVKNLAHSSKAASLTRSRLVQVDRANSGPEMVPDTVQLCKVQEEPGPLAAKHLAQHAAANSENSLPGAAKLSKGLMISNRLHPSESQQGPAAHARPSGLRLPSPSLRLFDLRTASESGPVQQKKIQHYRKYGEPCTPARPPMKSNDIAENIDCVGVSSSKGYGCPSPNYMLNTSTKGAPDSDICQRLVTKSVPRVGTKLEYECVGSEQKKQVAGHEEIEATWKDDEGVKVSHSTEQLAGNVGTCHQLMSEGQVPEIKYKSVLHNEEQRLKKYTAISVTKFGQSIQNQEENSSMGADVLAQTSCEQADAEKSDDASPMVNPESHLDAGSRVFVESLEQDGIRNIEYDVGTTKCVTPSIDSYDVVLQHEQETNVSEIVDDKTLSIKEDNSPCSRTISITCPDSHFLDDEADVIELNGIDNSAISFQNFNTEQRNNDAGVADILSTTTTSPPLRDSSLEVRNGININPTTSNRSKVQLHDSPVRETVTQLINDTSSAEGFNIAPFTSIENKHQLPDTLLLHDNPSSTDGFHIDPTNSTKSKYQLQDIGTANGSPKCFEASTSFISALLNSQLSASCVMPEESSCLEEATFHNVTNVKHHLSQEISVSSAILIELPGKKQDNLDVDLISREVAPLIDDHNQSSGHSHLIPQVEFVSETACVGHGALVKRESVLHGAQCIDTSPESLGKERLDIAAPTIEAQHEISVENYKSQEMGIFVVAEKSLDSHCKSTGQGWTGGLETQIQFQSENQTLEGSGPIISKTYVEDRHMQLSDGDVFIQSCSGLTSEVEHHSIENADHSDIHGKQAGFSKTAVQVEGVFKSNHEHFQQESVCNAVWNVVEGSDVYEYDPKLPNTIIVDVAPPVVEEISNSSRQLCAEYRASGSVVIDLIAEHNENCSDGQPAECGDHTVDSELEPSVEVDKLTCIEYCSSGEDSCSFPTDSMLEDQVLMKGRLPSTEKILDSVIVPEINSDASAQILPVVQVNGDNQPQGSVGTTPSVETRDYFTNGNFKTSFSVSQEPTTGVETTSTPELCCLVGEGDESLLTETTNMIEAEGSKIIIVEKVDATPMLGECQHERDEVKAHKDVTVLANRSNSIKMQDNSLVIYPPNAVPFSDEWLAAIEAAGEEILTMKCGAVQHSPPDKSLPEPSPWSPLKKKGNQIGPYDCTKHTSAMP